LRTLVRVLGTEAQARFLLRYASAVPCFVVRRIRCFCRTLVARTAGYRFFSALSHAAFWDLLSARSYRILWRRLRAHCRQIEMRRACPRRTSRNLRHGVQSSPASRRTLDALHCRERLSIVARDNGFRAGEGISNEVAGRFIFPRVLKPTLCAPRNGSPVFGRGVLRPADTADIALSALASPDALPGNGKHLALPPAADVAAVIQASQLLSSEIALQSCCNARTNNGCISQAQIRGLLSPHGGIPRRAEAIWTVRNLCCANDRHVDPPALPGSIVRYGVLVRVKSFSRTR